VGGRVKVLFPRPPPAATARRPPPKEVGAKQTHCFDRDAWKDDALGIDAQSVVCT